MQTYNTGIEIDCKRMQIQTNTHNINCESPVKEKS
jgi:hypothetical protein